MVIVCLIVIGVASWLPAGAEPLFEGRVRMHSGKPASGAQVMLFDLPGLRQLAAATTDEAGWFALSADAGASALPERFHLGQNYPNPFNPSTIIPYRLPVSTHVRLEVFNLLGQQVATLVDGDRPAGSHTVRWDGTDAAGRAVGAGVYLYRLTGDGMRAANRMVLIDGQRGIPAPNAPSGSMPEDDGAIEAGSPVHGLTVSGGGLVTCVDPAFRIPAGTGPVDLLVEEAIPPPAKVSASGLSGDVDNNGRVDIVDALLVALYILDSSIVIPNNGDISRGDANNDGRVDSTDLWLILTQVVSSETGEQVTPSEETPKMYWTAEGPARIQRADVDGSNVEDLVSELNLPLGIALDVAGGKMYWTDKGTGKIHRANLDGSQVQDLVTGLREPRRVALDLTGGKMYWADATTDKIQRSNLDGSQIEDLVTGLVEPRGLALDVSGGKMYWTDRSANKVQRANLDGSHIEDLVTGLREPVGLALDVAGRKIYWADSTTDRIQRSNLDGSHIENLVTTGLAEPRGLALDLAGGKIYWADNGNDSIKSANLDGSHVQDLRRVVTPIGIALEIPAAGGP